MNDDSTIDSTLASETRFGRDELPASTDVVVIGAGIAGLSAAITAASLGSSVVVLDAHPGGGRARTDQRDGFLHNLGPHALYRAGHLQQLLDQHRLDLSGGVPDGTRIDLCRDGRVEPIDLTPAGLARTKLFGRRSRLRLLSLFATLPRRRSAPLVGRSVSDWLADEPADVSAFVRALIRLSTYGNTPDELDAGAAVSQLQLALKGVRYLDGGWVRIIEAMSARASHLGAVIRTDQPVLRVETSGGGCTVHLADRTLRARTVVVAAGGPDVAERLTDAPVAGRERMTATVTASSLDLALTRTPARLQLGIDVPLYLSPHAPLARLAPAERGLVSVLRYLAPGEPAGEPEVARRELRSFAALAGITDADVVHERYLHQSVVCHGLPAAFGGGLAGRPAVDALGLSDVFIAGDWVGGSGFIADASAASGEAAGRRAAARCAKLVA